MLFQRSSFLTRIVPLRAYCSFENHFVSSNFPSSETETSQKIVKVAFIGIPNSGKSTLINSLIGYNVCGVSRRTETTKEKLQAALTLEDTQIVFVDTPGIVKDSNLRKFKLGETFVTDAIKAVEEANVIGVIHDAASYFVKDYIDFKIIQVLNNLPKYKKAFLVLNKIDKIKQKRFLLDKISLLTSNKTNADSGSEYESESEKDLRPKGWPNFSRVFLISALNGDGVEEIVQYLREEAHSGHWEIPPDEITDSPPQKLIIELLKAHFLDLIPYAIPRFASFLIDHFEVGRLGDISCVARVKCLNSNHKKIFIKYKTDEGRILQVVAAKVEKDLSTILKVPVKIKIIVDYKTKDK